VTGPPEIEQRLRSAFHAVAELTPPAPAGQQRPGRPNRTHPLRRHRGVVTIVVSVAAVAAVVSLLVVYGPHNTGGRDRFLGHSPATKPSPTPTSTITPTTPTTTLPTTTSTSTPPVAAGTQEIAYQAFAGTQVDPSLDVTGEQSGACYEYGGGVEGRDYYRCGTMQPCFAGPGGTNSPLVCPEDPVTAGGVIVWSATSVDTTMVPATTRTPWAMQLSNGEVCTLVNAAWSGLGPFGCTGNPLADCHQPQVAAPLWTADCQAQESATSPFTSTTVERVWY
jgi:hypothetical protein